MAANWIERLTRWIRRREPRVALVTTGAAPDARAVAEVARRAGLRESQLIR